MRIYVFVSDKDPDILGFTLDQTGGNLPDALAPWREDTVPGLVVTDCDDDPISEAVRRDGFSVVDQSICDDHDEDAACFAAAMRKNIS
jgi:hypothetical protein